VKSLIAIVKKYYIFGLIFGPMLVLVAAAYSPAIAISPQAVSMTVTPNAATVQAVNNPKLGQILADGNGMTLYRFQIDTPGVSNCSGACLTAWPALTVSAGTQPVAGMGVTAQLGTITRADGLTQVTVNGLPLYYFSKDMNPGDANGQGINAFGGTWYTVKADGTPNTGMGSQPSHASY
jgi:predicted lipoprotein with Yx(FWY)xxD motif